MDQSTSEGSKQTTDPLPESDDDPLPTPRLKELDTLFETKSTESFGFTEDFEEAAERRTIVREHPHERGSILEHHHVLRLWRG